MRHEYVTRQIDLPLTLLRVVLVSGVVLLAWLVYGNMKASWRHVKALKTEAREQDRRPGPGITQVKGKTFTFDSPKLRDLVHNMTRTDGNSHKTVRQAAAEAGFTLPPPGQDIGRQIYPAQLKPGVVIAGGGSPNAIYLGESEPGGPPWAYSEIFGPVPLSELRLKHGPHQGFYALSDDAH